MEAFGGKAAASAHGRVSFSGPVAGAQWAAASLRGVKSTVARGMCGGSGPGL